jgi:hypothetical protein
MATISSHAWISKAVAFLYFAKTKNDKIFTKKKKGECRLEKLTGLLPECEKDEFA